VVDYLFAALTNPNGRGGVFEIGGPDIHTYGDLMIRYARARGLKRTMFLVPSIPISLMAFGVGLMTPVPYPIAYALIGGLSTDSIVKHSEALQVFSEVKLIDFDTATHKALKTTHPDHIERVWVDGSLKPISIKHEGCFILHYSGIRQFAGENGSESPESKNEHYSDFFGELWLEQHIERDHISRTLFFSPRGLPGFLYWFLLYPFHWLRFRGLI
jgi:hypothetical protein